MENKYCVLLGDFNLDLLKFESHPSAENVLNTLGTFYFQSQIFSSYLSNRRQMVSLGSIISDMKTVFYGVPQGSILEPLLFLIYRNDFRKLLKTIGLSPFCRLWKFFIKHEDLNILESEINSELGKVHIWLSANTGKLSINI